MSDHLPESFSLASILAEQCMHHQEGLLSQKIGQKQPSPSIQSWEPSLAAGREWGLLQWFS